MTENQDAFQLLDAAERAAGAGDFESTYELLQRALRRQEEDLGTVHPDLAQTLNNLGVVAEKTGRVSEAEPFYRRAAAIAEAAFAADHPIVVASRQNLEDFCRAHGTPVVDSNALAPERPAEPSTTAATLPRPDALDEAEPTVPPATPESNPAEPVAPASPPSRSATLAGEPARKGPIYSGVLGGAVLLIIGAVLVLRPWSSREGSPPATTAAPAAPQAVPAAGPIAAPSASAPAAEAGPPPKVAARADDRNVRAPRSTAPSDVAVETAQLCRTFSTGGRNWRCDPAGDSVAPGRMVLYTRIRSARDATVVHRWYHEGALRQSVTLAIRANATEGYRTYSQQTVNAGTWRVEVRGTDGSLLHAQQFVVR
jgi:DUF2914 family protein/tetratricopeptide repeat protein